MALTFIAIPVAQAGVTDVTVFAASSLSQTFTELGKNYESAHPNVKLVFSFQSSASLAAQLNAGAPADLFASASETDIARVKARIPQSTPFVSNRIVLGVLLTSQIVINKMVDLNKRGVKWIQCTHTAPCGVATDKALSVFGKVRSRPVSLEASASSVVAKLVNGEVDAAFIYHTDFVAHSGALREIRFADTLSTQTRYAIGIVADSKNREQAQDFMKYVLSAKGLLLLAQSGFTKLTP